MLNSVCLGCWTCWTILHCYSWWLRQYKDALKIMDWEQKGIWDTWKLSPVWGYFIWSLKAGKKEYNTPTATEGLFKFNRHMELRKEKMILLYCETWRLLLCAIMLSSPATWLWKEVNITAFCHATPVIVTMLWLRQGVQAQEASPLGVLLGRWREDEHNWLLWGKHRRRKVKLISDESIWVYAWLHMFVWTQLPHQHP